MALERGGPQALREAAREQAGIMALIALPAAAGLTLVAQPLSQLLIGPALSTGAAQITPWIAASSLCAGVTTYYFAQAFTLAQRTRRLLVAMAVPAAANVILNLVLIPRFGLQGAVTATLASYGLGLATSIALGRRTLALPIPWRTLLEAGVATTAMVAVVLPLPALGGLPELAMKAGVGALVYATLVWAIDAGGLRSRGAQALTFLRKRAAA
jgi:O-antigen/teichoic acid export membrane protein